MTAWPVARLPLVLALLIAAAVVAAGVHWNSNTAGGSDSYGYVSQADLWLKGDLTVEQPWVASIPWPDAGRSFAPLGYMPRGVRPHRRVLTDPVLRADLRSKGLARAREFSWERAVARVHEIYLQEGSKR